MAVGPLAPPAKGSKRGGGGLHEEAVEDGTILSIVVESVGQATIQ